MRRKISWDDRLIKWFYDVPGVVDENMRAEVGRLSLRALAFMFVYDLLSGLVLSLWAVRSQTTSFESLFYIALAVQIVGLFAITIFGVLIPLSRSGIFWNEVTPEERPMVLRRLRHRWLWLAPTIFVTEWLLNSAIDYEQGNFWRLLFSWSEVYSALRFALLLGLFMYAFERRRIRVVKNSD